MARLDDFRFARRFRILNRLIQVLLGLCLIIALNLLSARHFSRIDLTQNQRYTLSPETLAYLRQLDQPIRVIVTYTPEANPAFYNYIERLLSEYRHQGRRDGREWIEVEFINIFQQRRRAQEIATAYGIREANMIVIVSGDRQVEIDRTELFELRDEEITAFRGEQVFTGAILEVSNPEKPRIYFLVGHGEKSLDDVNPVSGLSRLRQLLRERNYQLATLELSRVPSVPDDADLVILSGPQAPLRPQEVEKLRRYLNEKNGRMIALLDPYHPHGLGEMLSDWGLVADDRVIFDYGDDELSVGGDLVLRRFSEHSITQFLLDYQITVLFGPPRPVRPDPRTPLDERISRTQIMGTSSNSWAARIPVRSRNPVFDPEVDLPGPFPVAMIAERRIGEELGILIPGGRLIVFGNSDFIANNRIDAFGNRILFLNTVRWALDREAFLNIPPKRIETYQLVLTEADLKRLLYFLMIPPGAVLTFGLLILLIRRR